MLLPIPTPAQQINAVLDRAHLPHIRHLRCRSGECRGTVNGHRTTWRVSFAGAQLVCVCYLANPPKPQPRP